MLKVKDDKILQDFQDLKESKEKKLAEIEANARDYAAQHHYSEDLTAKFVAFTKEEEGKEVLKQDNQRLEILSEYIEEVAEIAGEEVTEATAVDNFNAQTATVNIV